MIRSFVWQPGAPLPSATGGTIPQPPHGGWVWVAVSDAHPDEVRTVAERFGIDKLLVDEALAAGSLPMIEEHRDLVYVVLSAFRTQEAGRVGQGEIDLFLGPDFVVSLHTGDVPAITSVLDRLDDGLPLPVATPSGLVAQIATVGSRRLSNLIDHLESRLDLLEELAMRADPRALAEVHALRRDVLVVRRVLLPQQQIFEELATGGHPCIDEVSRPLFERLADYQARLLEATDTARLLLGSVLETHRAAVADQTNEIVRVLTVFSAILLPLTLVSGIFGMNFADIPLADHPYGFWILVGAMATAAIGLWVYFGRRGFVGAVKLRDLPRAVGLGLFEVGTAPIRAVADGLGSALRLVTGERTGQEDDDTDR